MDAVRRSSYDPKPDGASELNFRHLLSVVDELGFDGWVGCEYRPRAGTSEGLGWLRHHRATHHHRGAHA
ncbi:hypothetical protein QIS99_17015 [Streptomyces sp. B-S-A8]|uniref:Hydroxypyruvate isomerase n=1 Tax=Streptomyces solicavernae TaxID=3043614 RepID=A0ABT6RTX8_9ACTN|nr:hypothetical protein [Streptomyces sp. B-S-A8]MDI3387887.1 hypothetical protein [Streptomyces sp. B-S-A8]